ncbi:Hypp7714 [Branchiostoma lanceolatum]|uniref:Hypp7714 protein n=1 Tax=Branchiostoma lanceolatum TaxID=7740 RepID=A0A8K0EFA0_BRALA|nr:Hypp7714 [Branchiostoma lanceolatum]
MRVTPACCISDKHANVSDHWSNGCWISDDGLSRVFNYLDIAGLLSCACVCSQWYRCAHLPDAWTGRTVTVNFSLSADHSFYKPSEESTRVLKTFGDCIRNVKLYLPRKECPYAKSRNVTRNIAWVEVSILVLAAAHAGHLSSLELHAFEHTLYKDPVCAGRRCSSITFPMKEFLHEVLACSPGLQRLVVNGLPRAQCAMFRSSLHNLENLRHFALNYTKDCNSMTIAVCEGRLPSLKKLVIVTRHERYNPFLLPTWAEVFRRLPKLRLGLFFVDVHMTPEEFWPFLRPDFPVTDLGFCTPSVFPSLQIEAVMKMIPDLYKSTLESFFLLGICGLFCQESLVDIVRKCTKLTRLVVEPTLLAETVTKIAEAGRSRLKTLVVQWLMDRVKSDPTRLRLLSADDIQTLQNHVTAHLQQPSEVALHTKMAPNYRLEVEHFI